MARAADAPGIGWSSSARREKKMTVQEKTLKVTAPGPDVPIYPIGVAARLLDVHPRTLRLYEAEGLIRPSYQGSRRLYSQNDVHWIACMRSMIHDQGISIPGLKRLLALTPCWDIADCPAEVHEQCGAKRGLCSNAVTPCSGRCSDKTRAGFMGSDVWVH